MTGPAAIAAIMFDGGAPQISQLGNPAQASAGHVDFQSVLASGLDAVNEKIATADNLVQRFAVDDSIPVHQVTLALEEARLSVELAMQVRSRLVEAYREFMSMQL